MHGHRAVPWTGAAVAICGGGSFWGFRRCVTGSPMLVDNIPKVFNAVFGEDHDGFAQLRRGIVVVGAHATVFREHLVDHARTLRLRRASRQLFGGIESGVAVSHRTSHLVKARIRQLYLLRSSAQFHGSRFSSRVVGMSAMRERTSANQACGSTSLSLAVYARRTMPSASANHGGMKRFARHFDRQPVVDTRHSSHAQRAFRNSRSRSFGRNRSAFARSYGFSLASADSFSPRCA